MSASNRAVTPPPSLLPRLTPQTYGKAKIGFLGLPGELRNKIYRELLVNEPLVLIKVPKRSTPALKLSNLANILCVRKQIRDEGRGIFYGENHFALGNGWFGSRTDPNTKGLKEFIKRTAVESIMMIKTVELSIYFQPRTQGALTDYYMDIDALQALIETISYIEQCFLGLETLVISSYENSKSSKAQGPFQQAQSWHIYGDADLLGQAMESMVKVRELKKVVHVQSLTLTASERARFRRVAFQQVLDAGVEVEEK